MDQRALEQRQQLLLVARERPRHVSGAELDGERASINGRKVVDYAGFEFGAKVGGRRKLPLGQAVAAVVLNDVNARQVSPHQVDKLPDSDGGRVPVAGNPERHDRAIRQHRSRRHRRHPAVNGVEAVRAAKEVGGALRRAADAGKLGHAVGLDAQLVTSLDDALTDGVVAAARAERGPVAFVVGRFETDAIDFFRSGGRHRSRGHISSGPPGEGLNRSHCARPRAGRYNEGRFGASPHRPRPLPSAACDASVRRGSAPQRKHGGDGG